MHVQSVQKDCVSQICKFVGLLLPSSSWLLKLPNRELKQTRGQRQRKRQVKINIWEMVTILRLLLLPRTFIIDRAHYKWTDTSAVYVNLENETFTVVCSRRS